ncbi:MAG: hypothetical protein EHM90_00090 [Chloroflexi bacterium]|nr:MAG: hypothetical protein EHM90_06235 [Chloroflexota bacterium]RPH37176.1 MAG: hypothetical protein EHM90_00090 [Chloroflexota bacterium]
MARTVIVLNNPVLKLADTELELATGVAYECQVTEARVTATPNYNTIPSTGCAGATQSPGLTSYSLDLAWLQDWSAAGGGLSGWADDHDGQPAWFEFSLDGGDATVKATGEVYVTAGSYGGVFGDGSPAAVDVTSWPCVSRPVITKPAPVGTQAAEAAEAEPAA